MLAAGVASIVVGLIGLGAVALLGRTPTYSSTSVPGWYVPDGLPRAGRAPDAGSSDASPTWGMGGRWGYRSNQRPASGEVGASIYRYGLGSSGPIVTAGGPAWFRRMGGGCVLCHGTDGTGGPVTPMMGRGLNAPDIRYSALTAPHSGEGDEAKKDGWTDAEIARAIREGIEPDGEHVDDVMPSWDIDDADMRELIDYLKELDSR